MDTLDVILQLCLLGSAYVIYLLFFKKWRPNKGVYKTIGWCFPLRLQRARYFVRSWKSQLPPARHDNLPRTDLQDGGTDSCSFRTSSPDGATLLLGIKKLNGKQALAEVTVHVKLADGTTYKLPLHPDTALCSWEDAECCWSANGLKIYVLEDNKRYRILYNGVLTRVGDGVTQHVKLNLLWATASHPICHPNDWSDEMAAEALALYPGFEDKWKHSLKKNAVGGWVRWGTIQGRVQSFDEEGVVDKNVYLRTRGIIERSWAPGTCELKSSVSIVATASDGTAIHLKCAAYKESLPYCISGSIRLPNSETASIFSTDLILSDFTVFADFAKVYTLQVGNKENTFNLVLKVNDDGGKLFSGVPYQQEIVYSTAEVFIRDSAGTGIIEVSREPSDLPEQLPRIAPPRVLKWLDEKQAGAVGYCLPFEDRAAACPMLVGGKGASLALLASVQNDEGYHVPPGFNLTTRALEKHLEVNPAMLAAIKEIEASTEDYHEETFKAKCERAAELFGATKIQGEVRDEILRNMKELRIKATEQKLGTELRFAVRSSAVGEDSEELSAAGQNDTILGCLSDEDILQGVQKCWGSMFAFTSTYYRRQNGQPCLCGGGVVVQAMVSPRAAGVMFTRHPSAGDPTRLLITANYGLGESVVSGTVEPDTVIVKREINGELTIMKTEVGTKTSRVKTSGSGIATEDVPESERNVVCLSNDQIMKLAKIGVVQEELWGAGRDIEWAVTENQIYLLQARPITSLERWTEEELLHELDIGIMSDDELISFGNTGEVLPKAITPLSHDVVINPLSKGMDALMNDKLKEYSTSIVLTHNRCALNLFNTIYRIVPEEIDVGLRMIEMAIHGHGVADQKILDVAKKRYPPHWYTKPTGMYVMLKAVMESNKKAKDSLEAVKDLNYEIEATDPQTMFTFLSGAFTDLLRVGFNHGVTSTASSGSQLIAMNIFVEGKSEFSQEKYSEVCSLFSSGDVLSAEVPLILAKLTQKLIASGLAEEFRAQDPKEAMQWLKNNIPDLFQDVNKFLEEHGFRAVMEFDMHTKPWVLVPEDMMKVLQNLRVTTDGVKPAKSMDDILNSLTTIEKSSTKTILRWILPLCQRSVRNREETKAQLVLCIHKLRLGYLKLGRLLVKNWYMPHPDLIFFFRQAELGNYIRSRDPALLKKAMQRQQYHQGWCKLKFKEINSGWVDNLEALPPQVTSGDVKLKATCVCGGEVIARACVVKDLSEIGDLKEGDILITHSTDIGWSPYFPLLTGIVTELGGLISHGAVIAREYGLPCIVGAAQATDIFKTGDIVRLSGVKGTVERVVVEDKQTNNLSEQEEAKSVPNGVK